MELKNGFIVGIEKHRYEVVLEGDYIENKDKAKRYYAILKTSNFIEGLDEFPVIGDYVKVEVLDDVFRIHEIENSNTYFSRTNSSKSSEFRRMGFTLDEVLFRNADYLFVLTSMNDDFNIKRLIRYVNTAVAGHITPVIILSKMDLVLDPEEYIKLAKRTFNELDVIAISSKDNINIDKLTKYFGFNKTIALLGMSGVGKSTLLNRLFNYEVMKTSSIREDDSRGRHTTTSRKMFILEDGTKIIDMPGIRSIESFDDANVFQNIEDLVSMCKFSNCTHSNEPGCAVKKAITDGDLTEEEFNNYKYSKRINKFVENKKKFKEKVKQKKQEVYKLNKKLKKSQKY